MQRLHLRTSGCVCPIPLAHKSAAFEPLHGLACLLDAPHPLAHNSSARARVYADRYATKMAAASVQRWAAMAPRIVDGPWPRFVSNADAMSPINGAVWVVQPSLELFELGLRVMASCSFNATHGWQLAGPPHALNLAFRFADGMPMRQRVGGTGLGPNRMPTE